MAILLANTFAPEHSILVGVRQALFWLTGCDTPARYLDTGVPIRYPFPHGHMAGNGRRLGWLDQERDGLKDNHDEIWEQCTIEYDQHEPGAEIEVIGGRMKLGFAMRGYGVLDLEKVILHEFLHAALKSQTDQHDQIDFIIQFNLHYPGHPNPGDPGRGAPLD